MKRNTIQGWLAYCVAVGMGIGCGSEAPSQRPGEEPREVGLQRSSVLSVFTVNYPLQYFAERIGGDLVAAEFPGPADEDPAYWRPSPEQIADYQSSDLILINGAGYAKWLGLAALPQSKIVDTSASFNERLIALQEGPVHSHGPEGEHSHKGFAFTTWLDPSLAVEQARSILSAFIKVRPEYRREFEQAFDELERDLLALDSTLAEATSPLQGVPLLLSHPVYQYLIRRYALDAESVHFEPDEAPTSEQWRRLDELLTRWSSAWMIWEEEPLPETEAQLAKRGIQTIVFRPCAVVPRGGDYLSTMSENVAQLQRMSIAARDDRAAAGEAEAAHSSSSE